MPPRIAPSGSRGRGDGRGRGGSLLRGGVPAIRPTVSAGGTTRSALPSTSEHITTVGVKRRGYGTSGRALTVLTNHFPVTIPNAIISHYDGMLPLFFLSMIFSSHWLSWCVCQVKRLCLLSMWMRQSLRLRRRLCRQGSIWKLSRTCRCMLHPKYSLLVQFMTVAKISLRPPRCAFRTERIPSK